MDPSPRTRGGVAYWPTPDAAQRAAQTAPPRPEGTFGGPADPGPHVRAYGLGWAVQAYDSGPYLGPEGWA